MPLFAVICQDLPETLEKRQELRAAHLSRLQILQDEGRVTLAGPLPTSHEAQTPNISGSLFVLDFPSIEALSEWMVLEPYLIGGVYGYIDIRPFRQTLP